MILILVTISRNKIKSKEILKKQRQLRIVHIFFGYIEKCKEDAKKDYDTIRNLNTRARGQRHDFPPFINGTGSDRPNPNNLWKRSS